MTRDVWRLIPHHDAPELAKQLSRKNRRIAVGWGRIGDLSRLSARGPLEICKLIREEYPDLHNSQTGGPSLWRLYKCMREGDLVILGARCTLRLVMEVDGPYRYVAKDDPDLGEYRHHRPAQPRDDLDAGQLWVAAGGMASNQNSHCTVLRCARQVDL